MKRILFYIMLAVGTLSVACSDDYDDSALKSDVADLANRIAAMEQALQGINNDLQSYASLVGSLQGARYIVSVAEQQGVVTVTYNDGSTYTLTSGTKGETGDTGEVGPEGDHGKIVMPLLKIDPTDGYWYLSYDGGKTWSLLLDTDGNPVQGLGDKGETGEEGAAGAMGAAPTLGVDAMGFWTIDLGDGKGPQRMLDANGDPIVADPEKLPTSYFESAKLSEDGATLLVVLVTGEELSIPVAGAITFVLTAQAEENFAASETRTFALKQQGVQEIAIERPEGWRVQVKEEAVVVTAPAYTSEGEITLYASTQSALLKLATMGVKCQITSVKLPASEQDGIVRAFPGAEGGGMYTTGGRGGRVIHVTNLNDSGAGSLRDAIGQSGPRVIVFDVAGTIELKSDLRITKGDVTIAGQTAPGDGICLRYRSLVVDADNVIIRFLRSRPGVTGTNSDDDGLDAMWGRYHKNIIIDHCSMSWSTDECSSFYTNRNFTMQWCLLAESLHNAGHTKGSHGYGGIWGGASASFHHNLLANHDSRNPRFDSPNTYAPNNNDHDINLSERAIDFRNNVVYNFCSFAAYGGEGCRLNFVGNYYKWGPGSINGKGTSYKDGSPVENGGKRRSYFYQVDGTYTTGGKTYDEGAAHIYHANNSNHFDTSIDPSSQVGANLTANNKQGFPTNGNSLSAKSPEVTWLEKPLSILYQGKACAVTSHSATDAFNAVLNYAGASLRRDAVDERNATHTRAGTYYKDGSMGSKNGIIDLPDDVGGYPVLAATDEEVKRATADADKDNIPDYYETKLGLNPAKDDATLKTLDPQGLYTNFEIYLHYLVQDIVQSQTQGGNYTKLE